MSDILNNLNYDTEDFDLMPLTTTWTPQEWGPRLGWWACQGPLPGRWVATFTGSAGMLEVSAVIDPQGRRRRLKTQLVW